MPRWPEKVEKQTKFEIIYKDEEGEYIWKYDLNKFPNGPISVENKWTAEYLKKEKDRMKMSGLQKKYGDTAELHAALDKLKEKKAKKSPKIPPKTEFNPKEKVSISKEPIPPKNTLKTAKNTPKKDKNTPKNFW